MANKATYMITKDFATPYVVSTHNPRNPTMTKYKRFKKGELIAGEMIYDNKKPNFVLFNSVCVVPLSVVKAVVTKEIVSSAAGDTQKPLMAETTKNVMKVENKKVKYMDAMIAGALIGAVGVYIATKKELIKQPDNKNYLYGAGAGAALFAYAVYRNANKPKIKTL